MDLLGVGQRRWGLGLQGLYPRKTVALGHLEPPTRGGMEGLHRLAYLAHGQQVTHAKGLDETARLHPKRGVRLHRARGLLVEGLRGLHLAESLLRVRAPRPHP